MIRPAKYLDLETCVVRVAALVIEELRASSILPLTELTARICSRLGDASRPNILPALGLLFLLGKLDYHDEGDAVYGIWADSERDA